MDFGADVPFARIPEKLKEHYGITVPTIMGRQITEAHGAMKARCEQLKNEVPKKKGAGCIIAEMDWSMIPVVEVAEAAKINAALDRRKHRELGWKEARLALAHEQGSVTPVYGTTLGGPEDAGDLLLHCAIQAGLGTDSKIHCVGDGAPWIADQVSRVFSAQADYLLDFYHVCEHLALAAESCASQNKAEWLEEQKTNLKEGRVRQVIDTLRGHAEQASEDESPARKCFEYLRKREVQLGYKKALSSGLPIGSGEVEGGHRYIIQDRLKLPGAWWKRENAKAMLALRVRRANGGWASYWASREKQVA